MGFIDHRRVNIPFLIFSINRVASGLEKSGKFDTFSRSGNCQGVLKIGK